VKADVVRTRGNRLAALGALLLCVVLIGPPTTAAAANTCLVPQVVDFTVNQGLGSYTLVHGKETLVKLFLAMPSCADIKGGQRIRITGGTLQVTINGATTSVIPSPTPAPAPPAYPEVATSGAPVANAAADPIFVVPGSLLPSAHTGIVDRFEVRFVATLTYQYREHSTGPWSTDQQRQYASTTTSSPRALQAVVEQKSNALRLLVVPLGDGALPTDDQFPAAARAGTSSGLESLSRMLPLPDRVRGDSLVGTEGLRYVVGPTQVDLTSLGAPKVDGKFCISSAVRGDIAAKLSQFLLLQNGVAPKLYADRVLGVISSHINVVGNLGAGLDCAWGFGQNNGTKAVAAAARVLPATPTVQSDAGPLFGMEVGHTFGSVDSGASYAIGSHSNHESADPTSTRRAYDVRKHTWLGDPRSVMVLQDNSVWHNDSGLFEDREFKWAHCSLGGPTQPVACANPGFVGSPVSAATGADGATGSTGLAAATAVTAARGTTVETTSVASTVSEPTVVAITGTSDGTAAGTSIYSFTGPSELTPPDENSPFRLVQRDATGTLTSERGVPLQTSFSVHSTGSGGTSEPSPTLFTATFPVDDGMARFELWKGAPGSGVLLASRVRNNPPQIVAVAVTPEPSLTGVASGRYSVTVVARDEDPSSLRAGLFLRCGAGDLRVVAANDAPTVTGGEASFQFTTYDSSATCARGEVFVHVSDGIEVTTDTAGEVVGGNGAPIVTIASPTPDETILQYAAFPLVGHVRDLDGDNAELTWTLELPGGTTQALGSGEDVPDAQPPTGGWTPGTYRVVATATDATGATGKASVTFAVVADADHDNMPVDKDLLPCMGPDGDTNPGNAYEDPDGDLIVNVDDAQPCTAALLGTVDFDPDTLNIPSNGNLVYAKVTVPGHDLRQIDRDTVRIDQIGPWAADLPAVSWEVDAAGAAVARFDRQRLERFLLERGLKGYVPVLITGEAPGFSVRAYDPVSPRVIPS
jgi:hypothetical protein